MKKLLYYIIILAATACTRQRDAAANLPPETYINSTDTALHNVNGTWFLGQAAFSGFITEHQDGALIAKLPVVNGRENGTAYGWYVSGHPKYQRGFLNGNREGEHRGWYENGTVAFEFTFHNDKYEGIQRTFFENGQPWQTLNYLQGREEGKQKSWNDSGRVVNNFTVKNGKLYGVIGRYDCMSVNKK